MYRDTTIEPADFTKTVPVTVPALTDAEIWSLPRFVAWLGKQPAAKTYCYEHSGACLNHQWLGACGLPVYVVGGSVWFENGGLGHDLPSLFNKLALAKPHTFGAALSRARAELERVSK